MGLTPEQVESEARRRAEAAGGDELSKLELIVPEQPSGQKLRQWAFIEVDPLSVVYSTRKMGAPITALKRMVARMLRQYHNELTSQQTRFNVHLLGHVSALEDRIAQLEERLTAATGEQDDPAGEAGLTGVGPGEGPE